jgi:hypothetical protein
MTQTSNGKNIRIKAVNSTQSIALSLTARPAAYLQLMRGVIRKIKTMVPNNPLTPVTYLVTIYLHDTKIHTQGFKKGI